MSLLRVIAWGNCGRGDDGAALRLAQRLAVALADDPEVEIHGFHQLGPEAVDLLVDAELVIFSDAAAEPFPAVQLAQLHPATGLVMESHHCSPGELLGLAAALGRRVPESWLVTIGGADFSYTDQLSAHAERAIAEAEDAIVELVAARRRVLRALRE